MAKALIVFASLTGNTEECAEIVKEALENLGVDVEMVESMQAEPEDFLEVDMCIIGTYTYGNDANLPDEFVDFYEELNEIDLTGKVYGAFGSGDHFYDKFCQSVDDFADKLASIGAVKGAESVKVDLDANEEDRLNLEAFAKALVDKTAALSQ
ncbi:flavodoxin, short chain [Carnobacterium alterfunditum]|uniref:Flavodoxin n=1 Tax=Carnobacterium alterfunditum TaxID=28230 RepID=A0A1N6HKB4_9LACT|nr:flavodoxin [Carnobacterium alterfunditum]SIO20314.1 flavodoxin, short chain [Carnobacterium alterfunditum]